MHGRKDVTRKVMSWMDPDVVLSELAGREKT